MAAVSTSELEGHPQEPLAAAAAPLRGRADRRALPGGRAALAGPLVALVGLALASLATSSAGVPLRDPGAVTVRRLLVAASITVGLLLLDILVRAALSRRGLPTWRALQGVCRTRWTAGRIAVVAVALGSFHLTYLAYRNIKSVAPLLRPGDVFDRQLLDVDHWLLAGRDPYVALHDLLGTDTAAHWLSWVYMVFFAVIPLALAAGLVLVPELRAGLFVATALSLTWLLGAGSYLILPSIGPFHVDAGAFAGLPHTPVTDLQISLLEKRAAFLADPGAPGAAQSIGAFASLHTAIWGTIVLAAHLLRLPRAACAIMWALALLTIVATVYFGWHYILDDVAGALISVLAVGLAALLTGFRPRRRRAGEAT
jgi:membrane-associated phospholipid phosphatase